MKEYKIIETFKNGEPYRIELNGKIFRRELLEPKELFELR